jgi:hypothetical protein
VAEEFFLGQFQNGHIDAGLTLTPAGATQPFVLGIGKDLLSSRLSKADPSQKV